VLLATCNPAILHPQIGDESATFTTPALINDTAPEHLCPGAVTIVTKAAGEAGTDQWALPVACSRSGIRMQ
jgi:hypothetical protein